MGQARLWLKIGPSKVPRPPPGPISHETDPRNQIFGAPGPLGAKLGNFELGGWGAHVRYSFTQAMWLGMRVCLAAEAGR